ncbi:MAG: ABC transporter ATP-binding protein [Cyanobacteriota bacterium]|nr:ABC transporter ATP-binding protein [Cyanobacteriota bacterium]
MPMLEIRDLSKTFVVAQGGIVQALTPTTLEFPEGRFTSIIGPSGCGKSTLFNLIAGLSSPTTGVILIDGEDVTAQAGIVSYMLQKDLLLPWRSILGNVILGMEVSGIPKSQSVPKAMDLMQRYGLGDFAHCRPTQLSGGMRQRAALIRTLLYDRDVVLLDEPFGALDAQTRVTMQAWLLRVWQEMNKTILFVTHDIDEAIFLSDRIVVMSARPGRVKTVLEVALPRPRDRHVFTDREFVRLKGYLLDLLAEESPDTEDIQPAMMTASA